MIDFKRYVFCCSGGGRAEQAASKKEKREQAPAVKIDCSTALIIPEDRRESRKSLVVGQFPNSAFPGAYRDQVAMG